MAEFVNGEIYTLTDEEGNENEFELLGTYEKDEKTYLALVPLADEDGEFVILRAEVDENGEELLETIDDDDEFYAVADYFEDTLFDEIDYDENSEEE